uniref:Leptin receptor n=1 Tax=Tetraodon nigroviridis TaxID=99883 RepID=H3DL77_TETNG
YSLVKPAPPVNLSHVQTIEAQLILHWADPDFKTGIDYEVRYSPKSSHPAWQLKSVSGETRTSLDLKPSVNYTVQVRRSSQHHPPLWSSWSDSHHIFLDNVSYIPEKVVVRPGENVTVYCVFNDHSFNASAALWTLNFNQQLRPSQYRPVNQWVSQVTIRPSETGMYDLLQCTKEWTIPYSQVYVEGASINISCQTNGDIDAMDCKCNSTQLMNPTFRYRCADLSCDVMEEMERAGENVGHECPSHPECHSGKKCTIRPLRTNCYKLWLEVPSHLGPIRSKPVYLTPNDHVKPHPPTNVKATSRSSGALTVTWKPPNLPVGGLQCQFQYHSTSAFRAKPDWKVQAPVQEPRAEVAVSDTCPPFVVQVRCIHASGAGYWSEWSQAVESTPQNGSGTVDFTTKACLKTIRKLLFRTEVISVMTRVCVCGTSHCNTFTILRSTACPPQVGTRSYPHPVSPGSCLMRCFPPVTATRGDPAIYMLLMIISFLSIVLLVSLILSQNQMKKLVWKDVPNPNRCSWARGLDLDMANTFDHMFHPPEGSPAWPLLLPPENISKVVVVVEQAWPEGGERLPDRDDSPPPPDLDYLEAGGVEDPLAADAGSSAQSSVTYATVLLSDPKQQDGGGCSSSDEGNFSANNSDISGSFPGGLWELDAPRRSCSYNSVEELSETSEHGDREVGEEKDL